MKELTKEELTELEAQLSCPSGTMGIEVGHRMNASNKDMTLKTISHLQLADGMKILELGHGNCGHLEMLLDQGKVSYAGLEVSATMFEEAQRINHQFIKNRQSVFRMYDGLAIPFPDNTFDRIFSVNTIYFWKNPQALLLEIKRVLKPDGLCLITYAQKSFMHKLPFIGDRFRLYNNEDVDTLALSASLEISQLFNITETTQSKNGEAVKRIYTIAKLIKLKNNEKNI